MGSIWNERPPDDIRRVPAVAATVVVASLVAGRQAMNGNQLFTLLYESYIIVLRQLFG